MRALFLLSTMALAGTTWPTPFTAEQIKEGCHEHTITFELLDGSELAWTFVGDGTQAEWVTAVDGHRLDGTKRASWDELRQHASYDKATTRRARDVMDTAFGRLEGWTYVQTEGETVSSWFFADRLPGPPVYMTVVEGDEVKARMVQIERSGG